jgi:light-regulated signal transduction histidine kinase (bacteriophytochrome)
MLIEVGSSALEIPTGARFLVVGAGEDEVEELAGTLAEFGHSTEVAVGPDPARRAFAEEQPDVVLIFDAPEACDAAALVTSLTQERHHLPVAVGPARNAARVIELFHAGVVRYLQQPFTSADVEACVSQVVSHLIQERTRRAVERELASSQEQLQATVDKLEASNKALERFAYVVSHDLQEPLRNVASYVQLLRKRYADQLDEDAHDFIEFAASGAHRMQELINGLLEYSRVSSRESQRRPTDMDRVFNDVRDDLERRIEETGASVTAGELPTLEADPVHMRRLLLNLVGNALKFRGEERPRIHVEARHIDDAWHFTVQDNGIGIPPAHLDAIFTIYRRLHTESEYEGTGIGLAVCKKIVERHGGRIWAESCPGEGTTFHFTIAEGE